MRICTYEHKLNTERVSQFFKVSCRYYYVREIKVQKFPTIFASWILLAVNLRKLSKGVQFCTKFHLYFQM